jgi:hypothetical protein
MMAKSRPALEFKQRWSEHQQWTLHAAITLIWESLGVSVFIDLLNGQSDLPPALNLQTIQHENDDTYDEFGVNTKNSFNTPPKEIK